MSALISGLLLFLPRSVLCYFGVQDIASKYRGWLSIVFVVSILLSVTYPLESKYRGWTDKKKIRGYLRTLPPYEGSVLTRCLRNEGRATQMIADVGSAKSLEKKDILWQSMDSGHGGAAVGYNITHAAYVVLQEDEFVALFTPERKK